MPENWGKLSSTAPARGVPGALEPPAWAATAGQCATWPSDGSQRRPLVLLSRKKTMASTSLVLTVRDVAGALHVSRSTAYRLINEGTIESIQVRGMIRVRPSALERYLDALERSTRETLAGFDV